MEDHTRRNAIINILGESLWGLKANLVVPSVILAVLLNQYGASPELIGVIPAIEISMQLVPQMLGGYIFHSRARRKVQLVIWHYVAMLPFTLIMGIFTFFADQMDASFYRIAMLLSFACYMGAIGVVAASWVEYFLGTIYDGSIRGTVMGLSSFGASFAGTGGALFAGWLIRTLPGSDAYAWLYVISWVLGMISISMFLLIKDPGGAHAPEEKPASLAELSTSLRLSLGSVNFRNYLIGRVTFGTGALLLLMAPVGIVGFLTGALALVGTNPLVFLTAFILPHGIFEMPAAVLATALALRAGARVITGARRGENSGFVGALADWVKVFIIVVLPLLLIGAFIEANITPHIVTYFFGG